MNSFAFEESDEEDKVNIGQRWTEKEENMLLQELNNNLNIAMIVSYQIFKQIFCLKNFFVLC